MQKIHPHVPPCRAGARPNWGAEYAYFAGLEATGAAGTGFRAARAARAVSASAASLSS
jgi:hypothetical protein